MSFALKCFWDKMIVVLLYVFKRGDLISYHLCFIRVGNCTLHSNDGQEHLGHSEEVCRLPVFQALARYIALSVV